MAAPIDWTPELVEMLIESVRSNKVLWDTSSSNYKNKTAQEAAWMQIAENCGREGKALSVKSKWRDLKDTYRKKLKLLAPKSGDAGGAKKNSWPWMQQMSFMGKYSIVETPTASNFSMIEEEDRSQLGLLSSTIMSIDNNISEDETSNNPLNFDPTPPAEASTPAEACNTLTGPICPLNTRTGPNASGKRKKREEVPNQVDMAILAELKKR